MTIRILTIGDIVGQPGLDIVTSLVPTLREKWNLEAVIANGENIHHGSGLNPSHFHAMRDCGVDVVTSGDHIYRKNRIFKILDDNQHIIRPANYPEEAAGRGSTVVKTRSGLDLAVLNVQGRVFMQSADCPFKATDRLLEQVKQVTDIVVIDFHAEATSEKVGIGWHVDGRASIVFGTHTHVPTRDHRILPHGTAFISDVGMTGPYTSVLGRRWDRVLHKFITNMPAPFDVAVEDVRLCGLLADINPDTGKAVRIEPVMLGPDGEPWEDPGPVGG